MIDINDIHDIPTTPSPSPVADRRHVGRDDLFTHIHKAIRRGLFDVTVQVGRTDWSDDLDVGEVLRAWGPMLALLRSHTRHEDEHLLRPLDAVDAPVAGRIDDEHRHLDDLLDAVADALSLAVTTRDPLDGLAAYRDLNRFIAAYLPHLHEEETEVMPRIWESCTDEQIAATRGAFMATLSPEESMQSVSMMIPAVDPATRSEIVARIATVAPPVVLDTVLAAAEAALGADVAEALRAVAERAVAERDSRVLH